VISIQFVALYCSALLLMALGVVKEVVN